MVLTLGQCVHLLTKIIGTRNPEGKTAMPMDRISFQPGLRLVAHQRPGPSWRFKGHGPGFAYPIDEAGKFGYRPTSSARAMVHTPNS